MAVKRSRSDRGFIQRPLDLSDNQQKVQDLLNVLQQAVDRVNGKLTEGSGDNGTPCGNMEGSWWYNTTPSTPDTDFTIIHNLGRLPKSFEIRWANIAAIIYQSPAVGPTSTAVTLRCTVASATLRIKIS